MFFLKSRRNGGNSRNFYLLCKYLGVRSHFCDFCDFCGTKTLEPMGSTGLHGEGTSDGGDDRCKDLKQLFPGRI